MGFLDALKKSLTGGGQPAEPGGYVVYVRCRRCGEVIRTRINLSNDLSEDDDGHYAIHKTLVGGARRCYARLEMSLVFDARRQLLSREVSGGEFVTEAEFAAAAAEEAAIAEEAAAAEQAAASAVAVVAGEVAAAGEAAAAEEASTAKPLED